MVGLDLPAFQGKNPNGWIAKVEHYFSVYGLNETEKIATALLALEGRALTWWQWVKHRRTLLSWGELKNLMLRRFRPHSGGSLCEQWMTVYQESSVAEYCEQFIFLMSPLTNIPEDVLLTSFIKGLKPLIRVELRLWDPESVDMAMEWALKIEEKYVAQVENPNYDPYPTLGQQSCNNQHKNLLCIFQN